MSETLPQVNRETARERAERYVPGPGLQAAAQVALELGLPLLLTGEPGTGKTDLAHYLAHRYTNGDALVFHTKSTSVYTDLFYSYDALGHYRAGGEASGFIELEALGKAIQKAEQFETRSVVLVDEIDKAPRDLPNDILHEIEEMEFRIKETKASHKADPKYQPILIFTSNRERDLPEAFLRRCVFYFIDFKEVPLEEIILNRFQLKERPAAKELAERAMKHFTSIRDAGKLEKPPATAELIAWVDYLLRKKIDTTASDEKTRQALAISYSLLAKTDEDLKKIKKQFA